MKKKFLFLLSILNKLILFSFSLVFLSFITIHFNFYGIKDSIYKKYPNLELRKKLFLKSSVLESIYNDYNVQFLPSSQFIRLDLKKKKLNFLKDDYGWFKGFFIEIVNDKIWIIDIGGNFFEIKVSNIKNIINENDLEGQTILSNLKLKKVLGSLINEKNIYISYVTEENGCKKLNVSYAKINTEYLDFKNFFTGDECGEYDMYGGKMQFFKHNGENGLLLTAVDVPPHLTGSQNNKPQDDNSIFGKIMFINLENGNPIIFSRGHRNPAGLYAENNLIISTEHGPWSGDEINKIVFNKNYGWPISSYGEKYGKKLYPLSQWGETREAKENLIPTFNKSHLSFGFEEPIFSFVPAIGISEIIKLPNDFSNFWINNFIVSSLWGQSLHRIKFDENFTKILFNEKIFLGERIRDLEYHNEINSILLAFEQSGSLGILTRK